MLRLKTGNLWSGILLQLIEELRSLPADLVERQYIDAAKGQVTATEPAAIIDQTLDLVEKKQHWSCDAAKIALWLAGMTRREVKAKFRQAALAQVKAQQLTDRADIIAATVRVVRNKQDWDRVTKQLVKLGKITI